MNASFRIGSILGITIRVHVMLVLFVIIAVFSRAIGTIEGIALGLLAVVLVLHELGHCLVARHFGIGVVDITLWPLGGMARMTHMPESSRIEGWIAAAGPAVNFALAAIVLPLWFFLSVTSDRYSVPLQATFYFLAINVLMGAFNLIPAFPTDGGRILRALLGRGGDWVVATERAVIVGRVFAVILGVVGLAFGNWMSPILAAWLWWMGSLELAQVRERHARRIEAGDVVFAPLEPRAPDAATRRSRLSDEDIERLEKFRGRLRPFDGGP